MEYSRYQDESEFVICPMCDGLGCKHCDYTGFVLATPPEQNFNPMIDDDDIPFQKGDTMSMNRNKLIEYCEDDIDFLDRVTDDLESLSWEQSEDDTFSDVVQELDIALEKLLYVWKRLKGEF